MDRKDVTQANIKFFDDLTDNYRDIAHALYSPKEVSFINRLIKKALSNKESLGGISILDIGTGSGYLIEFLKKYSPDIIGTDITHKMLVAAKSDYPDIPFIRADAYSLPFRHKSFDFITSNSLLHHLYDYELFLNNTLPLLKDGGVIFFGHEPNRYFYRSFYSVGKYFINHLNKINPAYKNKDIGQYDIRMVDYHQHFSPGISPRLIRKMLKNYGFKKIEIFYSNIALLRQISKAIKFDITKLLPVYMMTHFGPFLSVNFNVIARL